MRNIKVLFENPEVKIRIAGLTSCSGNEEDNQRLSERRVNTVREILIAGNIAPERIRAIGYGAKRPAVFEPFCNIIDSKAAKSNMRVLFEVIVE